MPVRVLSDSEVESEDELGLGKEGGAGDDVVDTLSKEPPGSAKRKRSDVSGSDESSSDGDDEGGTRTGKSHFYF